MRVVTIKKFIDKEAGKTREPGEFFECSDERFAAIDAKLHGFVVAVPEQPAPAAPAGDTDNSNAQGANESADEQTAQSEGNSAEQGADTSASEQTAPAESKKAPASKRGASK